MLQTLQETLSRLAALDPAVIAIAGLSLRVSFSAVGLGTLLGVPLGALVAVSQFPGRRLVVGLLNAAMGLPPVVIGLVLYLILSRSGPFGGLGLLFTPSAMIAAQTVLVVPLIAALTRQIVADAQDHLGEQLSSLGLNGAQRAAILIFDTRFSLVTALLAAFGRAISEIGAVLVVGGNIDGHTRTMTTAISLETQKGDLPSRWRSVSSSSPSSSPSVPLPRCSGPTRCGPMDERRTSSCDRRIVLPSRKYTDPQRCRCGGDSARHHGDHRCERCGKDRAFAPH